MAELGLFTPANPVTYATAADAAAPAIEGTATADAAFSGLTNVTGDLPPELAGRGFVHATACRARIHPTYGRRSQLAICNSRFFPADPWVDCARRAVLVRRADGTYALLETPCLAGDSQGTYHLYDLDGNVLATRASAPPSAQEQQQATTFTPPPSPSQTVGPGFYGLPQTRPAGRGLPTIGGVNFNDVARLLEGSGASPDLSGVLRLLAGLVLQAGDIRGSLDQLPSGLREALGPNLAGLGDALDRVAPGVGAAVQGSVDQQAALNDERFKRLAVAILTLGQSEVLHFFQRAVEAAPDVLKNLGEKYRGGVEVLVGDLLRIFRRDIEERAPVHPGNVDQVAAGALSAAVVAGTVAQLAAFAIELIHPIKTLGLQQALGVLGEFAGFAGIARPFFNATLRYGIGLPAEHRAAAHFRTRLPDPRDVERLAAAGVIPLTKYQERLVLEGYPEPYPGAYLDHVYAELTPRSLAAFTDGSEADRPWLAQKLRYAGVSPEDTARIVRALELKATQPGRTRLVGALLAAYKQGQLEDGDLEAGLDGAGLSPTHRSYYRRAAALERRGDRLEAVAGEIVNQYRNDVVTRDGAAQLLAGLGLAADEVTVRLTVGELRRNVTQVKTEVAGYEAEIRALKTQGLKAATTHLRAGFLTRPAFLEVGQGMGYSRAYLELVADLADLQGAPRTTPTTPAIGRGALLEAQERITALVAREVEAKRTDRVAAQLSLLRLGIPQDLLHQIVGLAEALAGGDPRAGDYGLPAGHALGGSFTNLAELVAGGLRGIRSPADLVTEVLQALGIPAQDRSALTRLLESLKDLFPSRR